MARVQTVVVNKNSHSNCSIGGDSGGISQEQYDKLLELINKKAELTHEHPIYALIKDVYLKGDNITSSEIDYILSRL